MFFLGLSREEKKHEKAGSILFLRSQLRTEKKTTITRGEHTTCPPDTQKDIQIQIQLPAGHPKVLGATTTAIRQKLA